MLKIGVFGAWRGNSYIDLFKEDEEIEIIAICDKNIDKLIENKDEFANAYLCADFDDFIREGKSRGMSAVFLANYFNEHTPYAIKAMEAGLDVISECTAAGTLAECVELVECVEKTGRRYMLAENYPFSTRNLKMGKIIASGELGTLLYAEGEYNHSGDNAELRKYTPSEFHWRAWMPITYYITHTLGPIMYMTKTMPKYVSARAVHSDLLYEIRDWRHNYDGAGIMFCEMDNGMVARFTGCTAMASDYSSYRVAGDIASVEWGGYTGTDKVRLFYFGHTKPGGEKQEQFLKADLSEFGKKGKEALKSGHGGGDYWIVQEIKDCLEGGKEPFAMSATAILAWRSCLNHGENFRIPDFRKKEERDLVKDDNLTPFPDENGEGITLPCALPLRDEKG